MPRNHRIPGHTYRRCPCQVDSSYPEALLFIASTTITERPRRNLQLARNLQAACAQRHWTAIGKEPEAAAFWNNS